MSKPIDANMKAPRVVDMAGTGSSSFGYIALTEVDRCSNGARSAPAISIVMTEDDYDYEFKEWMIAKGELEKPCLMVSIEIMMMIFAGMW
jgi:hypothetical protein